MSPEIAQADYTSDRPALRTGHVSEVEAHALAHAANPGSPQLEGGDAPAQRAAVPAVEEFLQLLARAVRQFRTYPATNPLCVDAIAACHKALASGDPGEHIDVRVGPHDLLADDVGIGAGTIIEPELVRRLQRVRVGALSVDRGASRRDLSRFCSDLLDCPEADRSAPTFADLLLDHGVDTIVPEMAYRPEVLDLGTPPAALCDLAAHANARGTSGTTDGPAIHLYPRDKGWIRVDPSSDLGAVSLGALVVLADDPARLAGMLDRLTDDAPGAEVRTDALERKYSEIATILGSLDPRLGRLMFGKLARAVLDLEPAKRRDLLRRTVLPGLLDGEIDGEILKDFPDVDLAESLGLLLDLEAAKPELVWTALDRLALPAERAAVITPMLSAELEARTGGGSAGAAGSSDAGADRYARDLVRVEAAPGKTFTDFAAFDLSIDDHTRDAIARIPQEIAATDLVTVELRCLSNLLRHEPNPGVVEGFVPRARSLLEALERQSRWLEIADWLKQTRQIVEALGPHRPDVAEVVAAALDDFCTRERVIRMAELYDAGGVNREVAQALAVACAASIVPACVETLENPALQAKARPLVQLMCDHAAPLATALAERLPAANTPAARAIVKVLGFAGPGCEAAVASQLARGDEQTVREALRALARIGTGRAASFVAAQIQRGSARVRAAAEEALWHLPAAGVPDQLRALLSQREFVVRNPGIAARLLDRAGAAGTGSLGPVVAALAPLRFRIWSPALARVGRKARRLVQR